MSNRKIAIEIINLSEYNKIIEENNIIIPIYMNPNAIKFYKQLEIIKISKGQHIAALYAYPLFNEGEEKWVKREYRFLPYSSPVFLKEFSTLEKKNICYEIYKYIFEKYDVVYLPLSPDYSEVSSIQALGGFVEERNTNVITHRLSHFDLSNKLRNHIKHAEKMVRIEITKDVTSFKYNEAIKGNVEEQIKRKELAVNLIKDNKGFIINAFENEKNIAGAIVIYDNRYAYLLHTWQNGDTVRGTIPLIIFNSINWCFDNLNIKYFDFEGSVIKTIDDFFASFNTEILTYPYIHFAKNKENLMEIIERSMNIKGRISKIEKEDKSK